MGEVAAGWVDTHAHIYGLEFADDLPEVLARAYQVGVTRIVLPNIDDTSIESLLALLRRDAAGPILYGALGLHPTSVTDGYQGQLRKIERAFDSAPWIAIGEVGLDRHWDLSYWDQQLLAFEAQLEWAKERHLAVLTHSRDAIAPLLDIIERPEYEGMHIVIHAFTGTIEQLLRAQQRPNTWIGIGGVATYKNGLSSQLLAQLDPARTLLETDSPYLPPIPHRGKRNEPSYIPIIAERLANVWGCPPERVQAVTSQAAATCFGWGK